MKSNVLIAFLSSLIPPPSSFFCVRGEALLEFNRDGNGLEGFAADGDKDEMGFGDDGLFAFATHFKIEPQGFCPDVADEDADFEHVIQFRCVAKVAFEMRARQPHIKLVEHHSVRKADRAKQLGLGKLKEAYVRAVKNDARRVNISPAHALLYAILLMLAHVDFAQIFRWNE